MLKEWDCCYDNENKNYCYFIEKNDSSATVEKYDSNDIYEVDIDKLTYIPKTIIKEDIIDKVLSGKVSLKRILSKVKPKYNYSISYDKELSLDEFLSILEKGKTIKNHNMFKSWCKSICFLFNSEDCFDEDEPYFIYDSIITVNFIGFKDDLYTSLSHIFVDSLNKLNDDPTLENLDKFITWINTFKKNLTLDFNDRIYLEEDKAYFVDYFMDLKEDLIEQNDTIKEKYREFLMSLATEENPRFLAELGYCYYGSYGDYAGFECDFFKSKEIFEKLISSNNVDDYYKGIYANVLGYIYYYGRTTNGVPDYESAFKYYQLGHACGVIESAYKLSDMYLGGKGTIKNNVAAFMLVDNVYSKVYKNFLNGRFGCEFADVSIRCARFYSEGIYVDKSIDDAYYHYKLAQLALEKRKSVNQYGDNYLIDRTNKNILDIEAMLKPKLKAKSIKKIDVIIDFITRFLNNYVSSIISIKEYDKHYLINLKSNKIKNFKYVILYSKEYGYINIVNSIKVKIIKNDIVKINVNSDTKQLYIDELEYDQTNNTLSFKYEGEDILSITTNNIKYKIR